MSHCIDSTPGFVKKKKKMVREKFVLIVGGSISYPVDNTWNFGSQFEFLILQLFTSGSIFIWS